MPGNKYANKRANMDDCSDYYLGIFIVVLSMRFGCGSTVYG
jgi:hypothetical protein